jgi:hypothetical protein
MLTINVYLPRQPNQKTPSKFRKIKFNYKTNCIKIIEWFCLNKINKRQIDIITDNFVCFIET